MSAYDTYTDFYQIPWVNTISPPIVQDFDGDKRQMYLAATSADHVGKIFQVYIYGELDYYNSDVEYQETVKQVMRPF